MKRVYPSDLVWLLWGLDGRMRRWLGLRPKWREAQYVASNKVAVAKSRAEPVSG